MNFDFALLLVVLTFSSGVIWAVDSLFFAPARNRNILTRTAGVDDRTVESRRREPLMVEYARSFFPIFLVVLLLRSFLVEPFRIPSGSMMPTLVVGDFILVNKFNYGLRLPVMNKTFVELGSPKRGDIVVFRYPGDQFTPYIKRVVGLPGDHVAYRDRMIYINGEAVAQQPDGTYVGEGAGADQNGDPLATERLGDVEHRIMFRPQMPSMDVESVVPAGSYFVMGDNRDNSKDSRYWGFVPDENLIGRAFFIWMNFDLRNKNHIIAWNRLGRIVR
jgi:signal peptidase I